MIIVDTRQLRAVEKRLGRVKDRAPKAISLAMNRTIRAGRTELGRGVRAAYLIKQSDVYATLSMRFASAGGMKAELRSKFSGMLPLIKFKVRPKQPGSRRPVHAQVKVGGGGTINRAFVPRMPTGYVGVFRRQGTGRFPIKELRTISVPIMVGQAEVKEPVGNKMAETFQKRIEHEIGRILKSA
jgi:hypothetical protein